MSLQVWLPLNKANLTQQGLSPVQAMATGSPVLNGSGGKLGYCIGFNSDGNNLALPASAMNTFKAEDGCSVCFWLKINSWYSSYMTFFQAGTGSTPWNNYIFGFLRNGTNSTVCFTIGDGTTASNANYLTSTMELSKWYHVALTYETGKCKIYLNGALDHEYTTSIVPDFSKITKITIGRCNDEGSYQTNCSMNDFRIYNHTLSADEVSEISKGLMVHWLLENNGNKQIDVPRNLQPFRAVQEEYKAYSLGAPMPVTNSNMLLISFDMDIRVKTGSSNGTEGHGYSIIYNTNNLGPHQIENGTIFHGRPFVSGDRILQHCELIRPIVTRSSPSRFDDVFEFYTDYASENAYEVRNLKIVKLTPLVGATVTTTCNQAGYDDGISGTTDSKGEINFDLLTALQVWENEYEDIGELVINGTMEPSFISVISPSMNQFYFGKDGQYYIAISRYLYSNPNTILLGIYSNAEVIWDSTKDNIEADCSGMGYHGAKMGVFSYSKDTPRWHASTYFKDYNSTIYCDLPGHTPTEYTMSCWIKSSNKSPAGSYHEPGNVNGQCYEFAIYSDGKFRSGCVIGGTRRVSNIANTNVLDGNWHMLTHTYDGSALKSYIDAQLVDTQSYTGALTSMTKVGIGNYLPMPTSYIPNTTYGNTELYESDFRLYMTALSSTDINNLYIGTLHNKEITVNYSFFGNSKALSSSNVIYELSMIPENTKFDVGVHMFEDTAPLQWVTGFKKGTSSTKAITSDISLEYDADTNTITYVRTVTGTVIRMYLTNLKVY